MGGDFIIYRNTLNSICQMAFKPYQWQTSYVIVFNLIQEDDMADPIKSLS